ncbi:MAG: hypothetical protein JO327_03805 [Nitrososphaeraceae archaeon]|nr:hypothetical protein [Nitrososphaeraceae archaeon]MBV9667236.1 hypothetical protein [Nitrososphaeraceae archaeon]
MGSRGEVLVTIWFDNAILAYAKLHSPTRPSTEEEDIYPSLNPAFVSIEPLYIRDNIEDLTWQCSKC